MSMEKLRTFYIPMKQTSGGKIPSNFNANTAIRCTLRIANFSTVLINESERDALGISNWSK